MPAADTAQRTISSPADVAAVLADPAYTVPPVPNADAVGTMAWLRASVSRFAEGETQARRRALVETSLRALDPADLRAAAAAAAREQRLAPAGAQPARAMGPAARTAPEQRPAPASAQPACATESDAGTACVPLPYLPVAVLAAATGVARSNVAAAVAAVRVVASAYHPGTDAPGADAALGELLALLPPAAPEAVAQHVALLVQACEATAALVRGALEQPLDDVLRDDPPVRATRRLAPDGTLVVLDLTAYPFGAGRRACPGAEHARALAAGVVEGAR